MLWVIVGVVFVFFPPVALVVFAVRGAEHVVRTIGRKL